MSKPGEDELWQSIVDNYGERPSLEEADGLTDDNLTWTGADQPLDKMTDAPTMSAGRTWPDDDDPAAAQGLDDEASDPVVDRYFPDEHFVPPAVSRPALPPAPRLLAWLGIFAAPVIYLLWTLSDFYLPTIVAVLLLGWFLGGFGYLVWDMPKEPREPWDDGAQV